MSEREKGKIYLCPICSKFGFAWDGRAKVWMCHWPSCSHTRKHVEPIEDQLVTMFKVLRYLVVNTPDRGILGEQAELMKELTEIIHLGDE